MHNLICRGVFVISTMVAVSSVLAQTTNVDQAAAKMAAQVCSNCHGPAGNSTSPQFPKLAGQQELYLVSQIKAFRDKTRGDPEGHDYMWGMATPLDDQIVEGLAKYYSVQTPAPGKAGDAKLAAEGKEIYEKGSPEQNVLACAGCHGAHAEGVAVFPRLAGQHADYIVRQITVIQRQLRESPVMHGVVKNLNDEQKKAVAAYLQSQAG